jgi:UDPglucose 6-dehydrogenase
MRISIFSTGYVGAVTCISLAELGHEVICTDIDEKKLDSIDQGTPLVFESGLETKLIKNKQEVILPVIMKESGKLLYEGVCR